MNNTLLEVLISSGLNNLPLNSQDRERNYRIIEIHSTTFNQACKNNPKKSPFDMALGTLTKAQMEYMANLEVQSSTLKSIGDIVKSNVGKNHSGKFIAELPKDLLCCTGLWLLLQGYLQMDFSLANDHAKQTSDALAEVDGSNSDEKRNVLMNAFYIGKHHNSSINKQSMLSQLYSWFSKTFS